MTVVQVKWLVIYYLRLMGIFHNDCIITVGKFWRLGLSTLGPTPELSKKHSGWKLNEKEELIKGLWGNVSVCCVAFFFFKHDCAKTDFHESSWRGGKWGKEESKIWYGSRHGFVQHMSSFMNELMLAMLKTFWMYVTKQSFLPLAVQLTNNG